MDGEAQILNEQSRKQMILPIYTYGQPVLRKETEEIDADYPNLKQIIQDMWDTLGRSHGVGLAAPQVGILRRVVIVDTGDGILELVNPTIIETSGEQVGAEGCLSVPGKYGLVKRPNVAKVRAQDRNGDWYEAEGEELIARCFCHELDHLDGVVYTQVMDRFLSDEELDEME
jgi:peptide deformylase